ncbi:MAG TPA: DUF362 domain-containing protein [Bacteroidales bacterium]|nr:DUF362 domain-containing protein [Bacteroidales bacterium]
MKNSGYSRRKFIQSATVAAVGSAVMGIPVLKAGIQSLQEKKEIVGIVRIKNGDIAGAVKEAAGLLGGIEYVTKDIQSIVLKPNLVTADRRCTTKPEVVGALASLLKKAGKNVMIGEGSAAAEKFNVIGSDICRTRKKDILDSMQKYVYDTLGYTEMARSLDIPLINLHSGDIVEVPLEGGFAASSVKIHRTLTEADLVCSVPMMKTHTLATVTLAMKNLIGLYPGTEYYSVRSWLHDKAAERGSQGIDFEIVDMNRAVKTGFCVIDASSAMEGNGPSDGSLVDMGLIVAGTSPLAADIVGSTLMGFDPGAIPALQLAHKAGMMPVDISGIEIRGENIALATRKFERPVIYKWTDINKYWGVREI